MDYDFSILNKNIKELMERQNPKLTQLDLADIIDSTQSRVSKVLSNNSKDCFTLEQIIKIAEYFNVSIDELLGTTKNRQLSMADILTLLCEIYEKIPFKIGEATVPVDTEWSYTPTYNPDGHEVINLAPQKRHVIYFDSTIYEEAIKNMGALLSLDDLDTRQTMLQIWKKSLNNQYGKYPAHDACIMDFPFN